MAETYTFTYQNVVDTTMTHFKTYYRNIDKLSDAVVDTKNNTADFDSGNLYHGFNSKTYDIGAGPTWAYQHKEVKYAGYHGGNRGTGSTYQKLTTRHTVKRAISPNITSANSIKNAITAAVPGVCGVTDLSEMVTTKGLMAYMNYITWFIKQGTKISHGNITDTFGLPCFYVPSATYPGLKNVKSDKDIIKQDDFKAILASMSEAALVTPIQKHGVARHSFSSTCSSSCSSSSCSSSSSSSCSSSCSSSSCSSAFIAYMKII